MGTKDSKLTSGATDSAEGFVGRLQPLGDVTSKKMFGGYGIFESGKMFALVGINNDPLRINLKCDPIKAEFLRQQHPAVLPGYHMNKRHWNTVVLDDTIADAEIYGMIDDSYVLVVQGLPKAKRPVP